MASRMFLSALVVVLVSVVAALLLNEIVVDAQHEPGTGRTLVCREPSPFWDNFERCRREEEHLFWVAGLTAVVAAGTAALSRLVAARGAWHRSTWIGLAAILAFAGVVLWGFLFEIEALPPDFH